MHSEQQRAAGATSTMDNTTSDELIKSSKSKRRIPRHPAPVVYVEVRNASEAVSFYKEAFGAYEYDFGLYPSRPYTVELNLRGASLLIYERPDLYVCPHLPLISSLNFYIITYIFVLVGAHLVVFFLSKI